MRNTNFLKFMFLCCNNSYIRDIPEEAPKSKKSAGVKPTILGPLWSTRKDSNFDSCIFFIAEIEKICFKLPQKKMFLLNYYPSWWTKVSPKWWVLPRRISSILVPPLGYPGYV